MARLKKEADLALLDWHFPPGLEGLLGALLRSLQLLESTFGHATEHLLGGRVDDVDVSVGLGVLEAPIDEVLHEGNRGGRGELAQSPIGAEPTELQS
jgi:hypothetical protein